MKPIDKVSIENIAKTTGLIVSMEEHQRSGGLGGVIAEILSEMKEDKAVLYRCGLDDTFSEVTGDQAYLREFYGISANKMEPIIRRYLKENNR